MAVCRVLRRVAGAERRGMAVRHPGQSGVAAVLQPILAWTVHVSKLICAVEEEE